MREFIISGINNTLITSNASFLHFSKNKMIDFTNEIDGDKIKMIHLNSLNINSDILESNVSEIRDEQVINFMKNIKSDLDGDFGDNTIIYDENTNLYEMTFTSYIFEKSMTIEVFQSGLSINEFIEYSSEITKKQRSPTTQIGNDITVSDYDTIIQESSMNILPFNIINNSKNQTEEIIIESSKLSNNTYYPLKDHDGSYKLLLMVMNIILIHQI